MTGSNFSLKTGKKRSVILLVLIFYFFGLSDCFAQGEFHTASTSPVYSGGIDALHKFVKDNVHYPESAEKNGVTGIVTVSYVISQQGSVEDVKIVRGIDQECDNEAIRVTRMINGWQPAVQLGSPVKTKVLMQVEFAGDNGKPSSRSSFITGNITDITSGKPIERALVVISGTNIGTITDTDGNYRIDDIKDENINLEIIAVGYKTIIIETCGNPLINIELLPAYYMVDFGLNSLRSPE